MKFIGHLLAIFVPGSQRRKILRHYLMYSKELRPHVYRSAKHYFTSRNSIGEQISKVLAHLEFNPPHLIFSSNPCWKTAVNKAPHKILEVGSWQGGSATLLNHFYPDAKITCIDSWDNPDDLDATLNPEKYFDKNTVHFADRLRKIKADAAVGLSRLLHDDERFDFIYIDGSHFEDDVLVDSLLCWRLLETGGTLVWDDYLWKFKPYRDRTPYPAINHFVKRHINEIAVLSVYPQIMVQKIAEFARGKQ